MLACRDGGETPGGYDCAGAGTGTEKYKSIQAETNFD
jgi:hypothetical protein